MIRKLQINSLYNNYKIINLLVYLSVFLLINCNSTSIKTKNKLKNSHNSLSYDNELLSIIKCEQQDWYGGVDGMQSFTYKILIKVKKNPILYNFYNFEVKNHFLPLDKIALSDSVFVLQAIKKENNLVNSEDKNSNFINNLENLNKKIEEKSKLYFNYNNTKYFIEIKEIILLEPNISY